MSPENQLANWPLGEIKTMNEDINILVLAPEGVGYGKGQIGVKTRLGDEKDELTQEIIDQTAEISASKASLVPVTSEYDTCSDGRCTECVRRNLDGEVTETVEETTVYKVFGGTPTMIVASDIGIGVAKPKLLDAFGESLAKAKEAGVSPGAHSGNTATGEKSGCGAIDEAPVIVSNAVALEAEIRGTMTALFSPDVVDSEEYKMALDEVFANYNSYAETEEFKAQEYSGAKIVEMLTEKGTPIKVLKEAHREIRVIVNVDVDGFTTNQAIYRDQTKNVAQVFAWDVPRNQEIADKVYGDDEHKRKISILSQVVYSLSTAATLTQGDLPVDLHYRNNRYIAF